MAETVHLFLKLNGTDIQGESSQTSLGRANSIECTSWAWSGERELTSAGTTGRHVMGEIKFVQRIDKSTPLLLKGMVNNEVAEGTFKFFRPNPTGDGTTEQFFTVHGRQGRITSHSPWVPDTISPATSSMPALLQVTMLFAQLELTYENGGITFDWTTTAP